MSSSSLATAEAIKGVKPKLAQGGEDGSSKGKGVALPEVKKKVDGSGKQVSVSREKSGMVFAKPEVKGKTLTSSSKIVKKTAKTTTVKKKAEKKVYSLPGQKYDPPEEREPLRIFYESLSKQIPSSEMAEFWMMEHGLLSPERAKKAYERKQKQKRQHQLRTGTLTKSIKPERAESSKNPQVLKNGDAKAKKRVSYSDDDDDFIVKTKKSKG